MTSRTIVWLAAGAVVGLSLTLAQGCSTAATCNSTSCPTGCCDSAGACQPGTQADACGSGGLCHACGFGQSCFAGFCSTPNTGGGSAGGGTGGGSAGGGGGSTGGGGGGSTGGGGGGSTGGGGGGSTGGGGGGTGGGAACNPNTPIIAHVDGSGGCTLRMVSPAPCSTVNFNTLGYVEFAWTTNTTFCEGPHHFIVGGNPPSTWNPPANNGISWSLTSTNGSLVGFGVGSSYAMTRNIGGLVRLNRAEAANVTSDNGQYHVIVQGFYDLTNGGSISDSVTFTIAP